jgi:hypothetical protein
MQYVSAVWSAPGNIESLVSITGLHSKLELTAKEPRAW